MNLNKMFVWIFVFFIMFSGLLVTMPTEFKILGVESEVQEKEVAEFFNAQNVTMYNQTYAINPLEYGISNQSDFGLPEGQKLEFWWDNEAFLGDYFELRHLTDNFWGWWWGQHNLAVQPPLDVQCHDYRLGLRKDDVLLFWVEEYNASYCEFACDHLNVKVFIMTYNQSWTLEESWDNGYLKVFSSYDIDWTKTGTSMWHIMFQLLAFQNPELGIPGIGGTILTLGFGGALWACIAILAFALITAVIPFIGGWGGGGG